MTKERVAALNHSYAKRKDTMLTLRGNQAQEQNEEYELKAQALLELYKDGMSSTSTNAHLLHLANK